MKDSQTKQIKEFYDENAEYQRNDRYSDTSQSVFTKPDDKYHWLVMKPKGADAVEVHLTDEQGVITARDNYQSQRNTIKCTSMERLSNDKKMIPFSEDEINILYQFGEGGKRNWFDIEKFLKKKDNLILKADDQFTVIEVTE